MLGNTANKKKPASIAQRRKGGGAPSLNPDTKSNNELFQAELPVHYNNFIIGYNSINGISNGDNSSTNGGSGSGSGGIHGHIVFYDQMTSVQYTPPDDDAVCICIYVYRCVYICVCMCVWVCVIAIVYIFCM